jgi:hypothetical protein
MPEHPAQVEHGTWVTSPGRRAVRVLGPGEITALLRHDTQIAHRTQVTEVGCPPEPGFRRVKITALQRVSAPLKPTFARIEWICRFASVTHLVILPVTASCHQSTNTLGMARSYGAALDKVTYGKWARHLPRVLDHYYE